MKKGIYISVISKATHGLVPFYIFLSRKILWLFFTSLAVFIGFISYLFFHFTKYEMDRLALERLNIENARLKTELKEFEQTIKFLDERMKKIFTESNMLRSYCNLEPYPEDYLKMGLGGVSEPIEDKSSKIANRLNNLITLIELEEKGLKEIESILTKEEELRNRTPSISPIFTGWITSRYGLRRDPFTGRYKLHEGIDISAPIGTPVFATANGTVKFAGWKKGYGLTVEIDHGNGYSTIYAHNFKIIVESGKYVKRGEIIAYVGNSGKTTGTHVHYEVRIAGKSVDPEIYIIPDSIFFD